MTDRPKCLNRDACVAQTPGKHCRKCTNFALHNNPEIQARRLANLREKCAQPEHRAMIRERMMERYKDPAARAKTGAAVREALSDPVRRAAWIQRAIENGKTSWPQTQTPEAAAKRAKSLRALHLAWCPPEYWEANRKLKSSGFKLAERQAIILADVAHNSPEARAERAAQAARATIARITAEMHAKADREKAMAY